MIAPELRFQHDDFGNAPHLLAETDRLAIESGLIVRVSGDAVCQCGRIFYDHDVVLGALWLNRACDGALIKL